MMDFSTLQGVTIPEGVVTQIESGGVVLWNASKYPYGMAVLEVEKITSNTYAGETTYQNEQFILLDIYPKTNGTVNVTYGGLTKTITDTSGAANPNAVIVYFGTFNGVSDIVETPARGTLTIEGDYNAFGASTFSDSKLSVGTAYNGILSIEATGIAIEIPNEAFGAVVKISCSNMTKAKIGYKVTNIGYSAFCNCIGLTNVTIPDSVTNIGNVAFYGCTGLTNVTIPDSVTNIGDAVFSGCTGLTDVTLKNGIKRIGANMFFNCTGLTNIIIPNSVRTIGSTAFSGCTGLTNIIIPHSVTIIEGNPFINCLIKIDDIILEDGNTSFKKDDGNLIDIENNTIVIGSENGLIPSYIETIGGYAFGYYDLTSITIPNSVTSIGTCAFYNCTGLTNVVIPNSVTSIGDSAFAYCSGLTSVSFLSQTPPTISTYSIFTSYSNSTYYRPTIIVPAGCADVYKAADGWDVYADYIVEAS